MTVENLHDAIGLLPSDLIAEADQRRCRKKPKILPLKRWLAVAACLAMVLGSSFLVLRMASGGARKAAEAPAAMMQAPESMTDTEFPVTDEEAAEAEAEAAVAGGSGEASRSDEEISADNTMLHFDSPVNIHATQYADTRNIGSRNSTSQPEIRLVGSLSELEAFRKDFGDYDLEAFNAYSKKYDNGWFEVHDLLIVLMKDLPANSVTKVTAMLDVDDNGIWELCISYTIPYEDCRQRTDRFILMEAEKNAVSDEESIALVLE